MPVRLVMRCEICGCQPDPASQRVLEEQMSLLLFGEYLDTAPHGWLTWTGRGIYGSPCYACPDHRETLKGQLQRDYGSIGPHPFAKGPHPAGWHFRGTSSELRRRRLLAQRPGFSGGRS